MEYMITSIARIRLRSWHDILVYAGAIALLFLFSFLLKKIFPKLSDKAANTISTVIAVVAAFIGYILITPLTEG